MYAFGVLMWELYHGVRAWDGLNHAQVGFLPSAQCCQYLRNPLKRCMYVRILTVHPPYSWELEAIINAMYAPPLQMSVTLSWQRYNWQPWHVHTPDLRSCLWVLVPSRANLMLSILSAHIHGRSPCRMA